MKNYPALRNKTILIVDDNEMNQLVLAKILQNAGLITISSYTGNSAIKKLEEGLKPDIILLDLEMPVMNGVDTCDFIRNKMHSNIPIVINSGSVSAYEKYKLSQLGVHEYLLKPYSLNDILSKLSRNLTTDDAMSAVEY